MSDRKEGGPAEPEGPKRVVIRAGTQPTPPADDAEGSGRKSRPAASPPEPSTPAPTDGEPIAWGPALAAVGGTVAAFSILFPWWEVTYRGITLLDGSVSGLGTWAGWVTLVAAWSVLLVLAYDYSKPGHDLVPIVGLGAAIVLALTGLAAVLAPESTSGVGAGMDVAPAIGAWLAMGGGAAGIIGFGQMFARRR